jgi:hypothetical protein
LSNNQLQILIGRRAHPLTAFPLLKLGDSDRFTNLPFRLRRLAI